MFNTGITEQKFRSLYDSSDMVFVNNIMKLSGCSKHQAEFIKRYIHNNWVSNSNKDNTYWECIELMHDILNKINYGLYYNFDFHLDLSVNSKFVKVLRDELDVTNDVFNSLYNAIGLNYSVREVLEEIYTFFIEFNSKFTVELDKTEEVTPKKYSDAYELFFERSVSHLENYYNIPKKNMYKHLLLSTQLEDYFTDDNELQEYYSDIFSGYKLNHSEFYHICTDYCFGDVYKIFKSSYLKGPLVTPAATNSVVDVANQNLKDRNAKIIDLHNSGLSQQKIADKLHMARSTVGDIIRKHKATANVEFDGLCEESEGINGGECVMGTALKTTHNHQWVAGFEFITCYLDGIMYTADKDHPNFQRAFDLLVQTNDVEAAVELINIKKTIEKYCDGDITIEGGTISYKDIVLDTSMTKRIIQNMREGREFKHLVRFLGNLVLNPRREAVYELFDFLENSDIEITEDGYFIAYKRVRPTYMDIYSNTFDNSVGAQPTMEPFEVDPDRDNGCSRGLHVGSWGYMPCYSSCKDDRIIRCKVNPAHVVAVPRSYSAGKLRTWTYKVIEDVTDKFKNR